MYLIYKCGRGSRVAGRRPMAYTVLLLMMISPAFKTTENKFGKYASGLKFYFSFSKFFENKVERMREVAFTGSPVVVLFPLLKICCSCNLCTKRLVVHGSTLF
jgi:hypothetical protein